MMKPKLSALLIHQRNNSFHTLEIVLAALSVKVMRAQTCKQAETVLCKTPCPHLVLTETVLADGNWMDVLDVAAKSTEPVNVIVVSPVADVGLYLDSMDHGAFDFMTDSFTVPEIVHTLRWALENAARRRKLLARPLGAVLGENRASIL